MKLFFLVIFLACSFNLYAATPDYRICDCEGDCALISSSGELMVSSSNDNTTVQSCDSSQKDFRITDNDGDVASISSTGVLQTS
jgi:hypothetical protein